MIITKTKVDKTFEGVECLLKREIIETYDKGNQFKRFSIKTERVNYEDVTRTFPKPPTLNEDGIVVETFPNEMVTETVTELISLGQKDEIRYKTLTKDEYNNLFSQIKDSVNLVENNKWQYEHELKRQALLLLTKLDEPYNTTTSDWILLEPLK